MKATERVWRTTDGRHVPEAHPDAAFLAYPVGHEMPDEIAAELYPAAEPEPIAEEKAAKTPPNKARKPAANK